VYALAALTIVTEATNINIAKITKYFQTVSFCNILHTNFSTNSIAYIKSTWDRSSLVLKMEVLLGYVK